MDRKNLVPAEEIVFFEQLPERLFLDGIRAQLDSLIKNEAHGTLRVVCEAHFNTRGKAIRPKIVYRLSQALLLAPGRMRLVKNWALALELLHNATLIHDDLQDGDQVRRNQPAIWARFGANDAINAGDFLLAIGPAAIDEGIEDEAFLRLALHTLYSRAAANLVNGQSLEFEMGRRLDSPGNLEEIYWKCLELKTSTLFASAASGTALISGMDKSKSHLLGEIFTQLGVLFQLQDDLIDLYGDKQRGQIACDLREGKVSCLVLNHLKLCPGEATELIEHLRRDRSLITDSEVNRWIDRFRFGGAVDLAKAQMRERQSLIARSVTALSSAPVAEVVAQIQDEFLCLMH